MRTHLVLGAILAIAQLPLASAEPASVTIVGDLQSEIGCTSDWDPACTASHLTFTPNDSVWRATFTVPAGSYQYGAALDDGFDEAYGLGGRPLGSGAVPLVLTDPATVRFYFDAPTHWVTDSATTRIVSAPGSYQSEIGCPADWQPDCLHAWLLDVDGDGVFERAFAGIAVGTYEWKVAVNESWDENYGVGGEANGASLSFAIVNEDEVALMRFVSATNTPSVRVVRDHLFRNGFEAGSLQGGLEPAPAAADHGRPAAQGR